MCDFNMKPERVLFARNIPSQALTSGGNKISRSSGNPSDSRKFEHLGKYS